MIGKTDLEEVINRLTGSNSQLPDAQHLLKPDEMEKLISNVSAKLTLDLVADWLMLRFCIALWFVNVSVKLLVI